MTGVSWRVREPPRQSERDDRMRLRGVIIVDGMVKSSTLSISIA
jgi:hypothetical protein